MKEIVIISGKGGTGKTSIAASFAFLAGREAVVADCDVDAADMHLLLEPDFGRTEDFYSGFLAEIDETRCTDCGVCAEICRFDAIPEVDGHFRIDALNCEGCGYCEKMCPEKAIALADLNVGKWYISKIRSGSTMVHARLGIGAENSGKLVAKVKDEAKRIAEREGTAFVLVDGSPGVGCPVVSSLTGAHYVVLVTEPTVSGLHDLKRVCELVQKFGIPAGCIINKADLNPEMTERIEDFLKQSDITLISRLPYDETFTKAMVNGRTIVEFSRDGLREQMEKSWQKVVEAVGEDSFK